MHKFLRALVVALLASCFGGSVVLGQSPEGWVFGDALPDAPELAARGEYDVGVRTLELVNPNQIDVLNSTEEDTVMYDRPLTVEVWYPAALSEGEQELVEYVDLAGTSDDPNRPITEYTFLGRAARDAAPNLEAGPYPLFIVSHGYAGSRVMMSYLTENIASKGYIVVAIAHTDSQVDDAPLNFPSTLYYRPIDDLFVLDEMERMNEESDSFLAGMVNADNTAAAGYSMGGYGVGYLGGAPYSPEIINWMSPPALGEAYTSMTELNEDFERDQRIKAIIGFAPWGFGTAWTEEGLKGLEVPALMIVGDEDPIAAEGVGVFFTDAINSDRYVLTYENAGHMMPPNPAASALYAMDIQDYLRYSEPAWDHRRLNNINQHFVTAFLGTELKGNEDYMKYLDLVEYSNDGITALDEDGNPTADHTSWAGFSTLQHVQPRGLRFQHADPVE
jgi:predicted dienelactone hydrolase